MNLQEIKYDAFISYRHDGRLAGDIDETGEWYVYSLEEAKRVVIGDFEKEPPLH